MYFQASGVIHKFIVTALFCMVKRWPHSSVNVSEWPLILSAGGIMQMTNLVPRIFSAFQTAAEKDPVK